MWFIRHKIKVIQHLAVTETDWVPFVEVCCVCMCVCVRIYYSHRSYTKVNRGTHWYIKHKYKKFKSHKVQTLHFYGDNTTRVRFLYDSYELRLSQLQWTVKTPSRPETEQILHYLLTPWNLNCVYDSYGVFDTSANSGISQQWINISIFLQVFLVSLISFQACTLLWRHCTASEAVYAKQMALRQIWVTQLVSIWQRDYVRIKTLQTSVSLFSSLWVYW